MEIQLIEPQKLDFLSIADLKVCCHRMMLQLNLIETFLTFIDL